MAMTNYWFGPFQYDAARALLVRDGEEIAVGRRAGLILQTLLAKAGQVVSKQELIDAAWGEQAIEESNLSVQVSALRRLIGAARIRTIERIGYRFDMPQAAPTLGRKSSDEAIPTLAVAVRGDPSDVLLAEITTRLARFRSIRLVGERGGTSYRAELEYGTTTLVRLVDRTGAIAWAERFAGDQRALPLDRIASSIESAIQGEEFRRIGGGGGEAYDLYLRGRRGLNSSRAADNASSFALFSEAIKLEPENPIYLAAATEALHHRLSSGWVSLGADDKAACRELAYRTLAVAGNDAVAIALAGNGLFTADEEDAGLALCRRALAMNPNSQLVIACSLLAERWGGSLAESEAQSRRSIGLAPNDPSQRFALAGLASALSTRGEFEQALDFARKALAFGPGLTSAHFNIVIALMELGRRGEAEAHLSRYLAMAPGVTVRRYEEGQHFADRSRFGRRIRMLAAAGMPMR